RADGGGVSGAVVDPARPGSHHRGRGGPDTPPAGARPDGSRVHAAGAFPAAGQRRGLTARGPGGLDVPGLTGHRSRGKPVIRYQPLSTVTTAILATTRRMAADGLPSPVERCYRPMQPTRPAV